MDPILVQNRRNEEANRVGIGHTAHKALELPFETLLKLQILNNLNPLLSEAESRHINAS